MLFYRLRLLCTIEILEIVRSRTDGLVDDYLVYKGHVCRQVYRRTSADLLDKLWELEREWPEYATSTLMISRPHYLTRRTDHCKKARAWVEAQA